MDVELGEEHVLLRDSVRGQVTKHAPPSVEALDTYDDAPLWRELASSGVLGLGVPATFGGAGTIVDAAIASIELGRRTAPVPVLGSAMLPAQLLAAEGANSSLIEALISGDLRLSVGIDPETGDIANLSSSRALAYDSADAVAALVWEQDTRRRLRAVALGAPTHGVDLTRTTRWCQLHRSIDVGLDEVSGSVSPAAQTRWTAIALVLVAADMVGVMDGALALGVDHAGSRQQFGVAIGSFQSLQHLLAEQQVNLVAARSLLTYAAWAIDHRPIDEARRAAHAAKAYAADVGKPLCEAVMQVHGGMGMTWECWAHVFTKRMLFDRHMLGDEHTQLRAVWELAADGGRPSLTRSA